MTRHLLASSALAALIATPAIAQQPEPEVPAETEEEAARGDAIVITGHIIEGLDLLAGATVVEGDELTRNLETQIGDTLASQPGVSATSFAPGVSRPVLRGFSGERVRVLNDGIGSIDVSNTSVDHAVSIDPLTAERVEVIRGPASLIFGGQAIGGAVNVIDRRIPRTVGERPVHIDGLGQLRSADDGIALGAALDVNLGSDIVAHVDGNWNRGENVETGGFIIADPLRAELLAEAAEEREEGHPEEAAELEEFANLRGELPNSQTEQWSAAAGLGYIGERLEVGASYTIFDSDYGIPSRPGAGHHHGEEGEGDEEGGEEEELVTIDLRQERFDGRAQLNLEGFFESVTLRAAFADYTHTEFEGDEVGTVFNSDGFEGRLQAKQRDRGGLHGAFGLQYYTRDFEAIGPEAFLPPNSSDSVGLFALQEYQPDRLGVEGALRVDFTNHQSQPIGEDRDFTAFSGALGVNYEAASDLTIGANASYTQRAPSPEELFSNGPHIATQAFEIGDPDLDIEASLGGELFARYEGRDYALSATAWTSQFTDFIYERETGVEEDGLPVFQYLQQGADFFGFEVEASAIVLRSEGWNIGADFVGDYVRAELDDGTNVPRIPPLRLMGGLTYEAGPFEARGEVEYVAEQDDVAAFETPTDGFTMVNASLRWRPGGGDSETVLMLQANNIFDVEARRHASVTKDFVPLTGRDIRATARFSF